jgi:hypothetical protein
MFAFIRSLVLAVCILISAPAKSEAQSYGTVAEYWTFACTSGLNTNIFDVLNDIFVELGSIQGFVIDLDSILNFEFNPFEMQGCNLPNINFGGIELPAVNGLFSCFTALPNLSGMFSNMAGCVSGILGQFPSLSNLLAGVDFSSVFSCMINVQTPQLPTLSVPDIIGGLLGKIDTIMGLLGQIEFQLPNLRKLVDWSLQICETFQAGGGVGAAMAGASVASSSSMNSNGVANVGVTINPNALGSTGQTGGTSGAGLAAASTAKKTVAALIVSSKKKLRYRDLRTGRRIKGFYMEMFPLKRAGVNRYSAKVDTSKLPRGGTYYSTIYVQGVNKVLMVPGPIQGLKRR